MTTWHVLLGDGKVSGPYSECQIRNGIQQGKIDDPMRVRQGNSPWIRVSKVKELFSCLDEKGFFIRDEQHAIYGPFTETRLQAMKLGNNLPLVYWIRKGKFGAWKHVDRRANSPVEVEQTQTYSEPVPAQAEPTVAMTAHSVTVDEASTISITAETPAPIVEPKAVVPAAPVMKLRTNSWVNTIAGISERFENLILGDPLAN